MKAPLAHLSLNRIDEALFQTTAIRQFEYLLNVSLGVGARARALILGTIGLVALATAAFLSNTLGGRYTHELDTCNESDSLEIGLNIGNHFLYNWLYHILSTILLRTVLINYDLLDLYS